MARRPVARTHSIFYEHPFETGWPLPAPGPSDDSDLPSKQPVLAHEDTHPGMASQFAQAGLELRLARTNRPFSSRYHVPKTMQLAGWDRVAELDDLSVGTPEPDHPPIGREGRERVESGGADMPPDRLKILARGAPNAQAKIGDELIDVSEHGLCRTVAA